MSNLPQNVLNHNPNGTWGFLGSVSARLAYHQLDGSLATDEQLKLAQQHGPRLAHLKPRVFSTKANALEALAIADARESAGAA